LTLRAHTSSKSTTRGNESFYHKGNNYLAAIVKL
jgi:hypothetical protein